jgi:hypothetical protein
MAFARKVPLRNKALNSLCLKQTSFQQDVMTRKSSLEMKTR